MIQEKWSTEDTMVYLPTSPGQDRRSFRCECKCNVFRRSLENQLRYKCNSCEAVYVGEK